ncbi:unnamed protein product [Amoebophrya sp. A25]|nr:unnamed protein product [Amoebophrya sp. A25]|eukprot:GSA25T00014254001.1
MSQVDGKNKEFIALAHHIKDARAARKQAAASGPKREQQKAKKSALFFGGGEDDKNAKNTSSTTTLTNQKTEKTQQVEHSNNENKENYKNNSFSEMEAIPRGLSPMDVARRQGHGEIVSILEEHQNKLAREREVRHQERRDAGCLNSDSDAEDAEDRYLLKKYRTSQLMKDEEAAKQVVMPA